MPVGQIDRRLVDPLRGRPPARRISSLERHRRDSPPLWSPQGPGKPPASLGSVSPRGWDPAVGWICLLHGRTEDENERDHAAP